MDTASSDPSADPDADPLKPESSGKLDYRLHAERTMSMVVGEPSVTDVRKVGLGVGGLCLLLGLLLGLPLLRDQEGAKSAARIQLRYGERIVPVSDLALGDGPVADVSSIDALADLAKRYESVIMHATVDGAETYLVWDNGFTYRYQPTDAGSTSETEPDPLERALSDHDWDAFAELSRDEHEHRPG